MMKLGHTIPFSFFDSQGLSLSGYAIGDVIAESAKIPEGYVGTVKDNDTIFEGQGGSIDYLIKYASGGEAKFRSKISSDDSGFVNKLLKTGDRVIIKLAAAGDGRINLIWHGDLTKVKEYSQHNTDFDEDDL